MKENTDVLIRYLTNESGNWTVVFTKRLGTQAIKPALHFFIAIHKRIYKMQQFKDVSMSDTTEDMECLSSQDNKHVRDNIYGQMMGHRLGHFTNKLMNSFLWKEQKKGYLLLLCG